MTSWQGCVGQGLTFTSWMLPSLEPARSRGRVTGWGWGCTRSLGAGGRAPSTPGAPGAGAHRNPRSAGARPGRWRGEAAAGREAAAPWRQDRDPQRDRDRDGAGQRRPRHMSAAGPARPAPGPAPEHGGGLIKKKEVWVYNRTDEASYTKEVAPALCF